MIKKLIIVLSLALSALIGYAGDDKNKGQLPTDSTSLRSRLPPPVNVGRPDSFSSSPIVCSYGPGFLELALPHGVQYIKVRIFNSLQDWNGMVTVEQSRVEIPLFTGECRIICWTDDNRQYFGKLNFPNYR